MPKSEQRSLLLVILAVPVIGCAALLIQRYAGSAIETQIVALQDASAALNDQVIACNQTIARVHSADFSDLGRRGTLEQTAILIEALNSGGQVRTSDGYHVTILPESDRDIRAAISSLEIAFKDFETSAEHCRDTAETHDFVRDSISLNSCFRETLDAYRSRIESQRQDFKSSQALSFWVLLTVMTVTGVLTSRYLLNRLVDANTAGTAPTLEIAQRILQFARELSSATAESISSIDEISKSSQVAASSLGTALNTAQESCQIVGSLGEYTDSVARLISEITSISEQTNLLALNATIESARAGDAGKGFSVVANEVKQLANVTHATADNVIKQVKGIQASSDATIRSTQNALELMRKSNDSQSDIANAVEQQREILRQLACQATALASEAESFAEGTRPVKIARNSDVQWSRSFGLS
ncbi:MAG: methyl-accepting chemotaxis protein [Planctomycetaceae bacterium]